jgi:predicted kinase
MDIELNILMGLPGSGKTTFAKELGRKLGSQQCVVLHLDDLRSNCFQKKTPLRSLIGDELYRRHKKTMKAVVIDGPIFTNEDLFQTIIATAPSFHKVSVKVYHWNEDRDTCLKNDGGRRETPSANTILHATYEYVDVDGLNSKLLDWDAQIIKVINKTVFLKDDWYRYFKQDVYIASDNMLRSSRWCTGGAYGSCWHNGLTQISPDKPLPFTELDELLEKVCPSITFLHYKKVLDKCVSTEETHENDYYGGGTNYMNWVCDLPQLYTLLHDLGYVVEDN